MPTMHLEGGKRSEAVERELKKTWPKISNALSIIKNKEQFEETKNLLNKFLDEVGNKENHALIGIVDLLGLLIADYEKRHFPEPKAPPTEVLKYLMKERGLKQKDLASILGTQSIVSEILNGKRRLNVKQVAALSKKFNVSSSVFIE